VRRSTLERPTKIDYWDSEYTVAPYRELSCFCSSRLGLGVFGETRRERTLLVVFIFVPPVTPLLLSFQASKEDLSLDFLLLSLCVCMLTGLSMTLTSRFLGLTVRVWLALQQAH